MILVCVCVNISLYFAFAAFIPNKFHNNIGEGRRHLLQATSSPTEAFRVS